MAAIAGIGSFVIRPFYRRAPSSPVNVTMPPAPIGDARAEGGLGEARAQRLFVGTLSAPPPGRRARRAVDALVRHEIEMHAAGGARGERADVGAGRRTILRAGDLEDVLAGLLLGHAELGGRPPRS